MQEESRVSSLEDQLASARAEVAEERRHRQQAASTITQLKGQLMVANQTHVRCQLSSTMLVPQLPISHFAKETVELD